LLPGYINLIEIMSEQRPWLANYPSGIPANINPDAYPNLVALIEDSFQKFRDKKAFIFMDKSITYGELDKLSRQFGAYLHSRGLEPGDKVALMMPNLLQYPIALFGALRAGLVTVNTNPLYTPREMKHQFTDSGAKAIIIAENFAANLQKIIGETEIKTVVLTSIGEMLGFPKKQLTNFVVRSVKKMVPSYDIPNAVTFTEALSQGKSFQLPEFANDPDRLIALQYTGGTTGVSKGAMLTNRNMVANTLQARAWTTASLETGVNALCPLPLYHIFAFTVNCLALFSYGVCNVLIPNPRDLDSVVSAMDKYKVTVMTGVNTLFNALLNNSKFQRIEHHLQLTVGGGMAVQRPVAERWQKVTGCPLSEGYGMTEASPCVSMNPLDGTERLGTIGVPLPSTDVRIFDAEQGGVVGFDTVGEIQVRGPQVMKGYYNRPSETAKTLDSEGWLSTGDMGTMSTDGFIQIVDRKKDMILVSGFNVYPNEIEEVVAGHPKVLEVAAVGVPDAKSGEVVKIFVVKKDKGLNEKELIDYCRENMTGYKIPKHVEFREELPKTNVGKILRRALREEASKA
jgi:long-chain acyl-CoA synthetase